MFVIKIKKEKKVMNLFNWNLLGILELVIVQSFEPKYTEFRPTHFVESPD